MTRVIPALEALFKPEYAEDPCQILRRLSYACGLRGKIKGKVFDLLWGEKIFLFDDCLISKALLTVGVYELEVTEAVYRLVKSGDIVVDVGANVGYYTSLMLSRCGPEGLTYSFEPHPDLFKRMEENVDLHGNASRSRLYNIALSNTTSTAELYIPDTYKENSGASSLTSRWKDGRYKSLEVPVERFDYIMDHDQISLMKIDVEGHEMQVLEGCERLMDRGGIRAIIFEDWTGEVIEFLDRKGWSIFFLMRARRGLKLLDVNISRERSGAPNYLAFKDPSIMALFNNTAWTIYK